jgi:hypothetical protein
MLAAVITFDGHAAVTPWRGRTFGRSHALSGRCKLIITLHRILAKIVDDNFRGLLRSYVEAIIIRVDCIVRKVKFAGARGLPLRFTGNKLYHFCSIALYPIS